MALFTSSMTGNWSSSATWGGAGVPGVGDTVSIGAHTVTVDVNTTVGTSPNDTTTKVIDRTSGSSKLIVATGVTLIVKGNVGGVNDSTLQLNAGSTLTFDPSASGGTPVYNFINFGADIYAFNGTPGSRCAINALPGFTFALAMAHALNATYTDFSRCSKPRSTNSALAGINLAITHCTFDFCGVIDISFSTSTLSFTFTDNMVTNSTDATDSVELQMQTARTSGNRIFSRNVLDKSLTLVFKNMTEMTDNVIGGIGCLTGGLTTFDRTPWNNFIGSTLNLNAGGGVRIVGSWDRLYVAREGTAGNPHFLGPLTDGADCIYTQVIFESQMPDLIDTGDCFLLNQACCTAGTKIVAKNCIALKSGYSGANVQSGQLLTSYMSPATNSTHQFQGFRCTVNQDTTSVAGVGNRAAFAFAEGTSGAADQVSALKSNLVWGSTASQGYISERISGTVKDHITPSGCDYNWSWNLSVSNNQRGYQDRANSPAQTLWTAGDAVAAGVDTHQGTGDPQFHDSTRNVATWCAARGYGAATYAAGKAALQADPTRVGDLINYVFEGFRAANPACRNAAHDGGCVGAANFYKARSSAITTAHRNQLMAKFGVL